MLHTTTSVDEPREAHRLNEIKLAAFLRGLPDPLEGPLRVAQFQHGQSNPTYLLTVGEGAQAKRFVLRKKPPGALLASAHAVDREYRVLRALAPTRVPVPRPLALCTDEAVLGTPFYVMEFAEGVIHPDPNMPAASAGERRAAYAALASTLAALHSLHPAALGLSGFGNPAHYCRRQLGRWAAQYVASVAAPAPKALQLVGWLQDHVPPTDADPAGAAVVHGDYRLDNLVFDPATMEVRAVLDWELSTLGSPWGDVAYAAMAYHLPPALMPQLALQRPLPPGVPDERSYLAAYCAARGVAPPSPADWAFYLALSLFRLLAILAGVQARARQGNASSARAAAVSSDSVLDALADAAHGIVRRCGGDPTAGDAASIEARIRALAHGSGGGGGGDGKGRRSPPPPPRAPVLGAPSPAAAHLRARVEAFMAAHVYAAEAMLYAHSATDARWTPHPLVEQLKAQARAQGLWNLWVPADMAASLQWLLPLVPEAERGSLLGARLSNLDYAHVCEVMGRSVWAPELFNCSAPDTGNMEVLARYGSSAQQERWLLPLLRGHIRSCFAMTEKEVASSDATNITASIERAPQVAIFMGKTSTAGPAHRQQSMILVPMDAPGVTVERALCVMGYDDAPHGHAEVVFDRVAVGEGALVLGEGRGFEIAQGRLGPGRLHHCMRLVGMGERGVELMAQRALQRKVFGGRIADQGGFQQVLGRCRVDLDAARLIVLNAANALDKVGFKAARGEIAAAKVAVPSAVLRVLDAAMQVHGGAGVSQDTVLAHFWAGARTLRLADGPDEVHLATLAKMELARARARL